MRKLPKVISLFLAGLMAISSFGMSVLSTLAATVDSAETGAIMTEEERIAAGHELVYFKFPKSVWGPLSSIKWSTKKHTVNICCQFYAIYGNKKEVSLRAWEAPSTNMMADSAGGDTFYFDITESKQIAEKDDTDDHKLEPGAAYGILFSTKANAGSAKLLQPNGDGFQTCDLYFDTSCVGKTYIVDEPYTVRENSANSSKIDYYAHALDENGEPYEIGAPIEKCTTLCAYLEGSKHSPATDSVEMANRLNEFLTNPINEPSFTTAKVKNVMDALETNGLDVFYKYKEKFGDEYDAGVQYVHQDGVDDQKADGSLKDVYRYRKYTKNPGTPNEEYLLHPDYDLVAERVGLPKDVPQLIEAVDLTLDGENVNIPNDANYTVTTEKKDGKLVTTVSPKSGYAFTAKPVCNKTGFSDDTTVTYDNNKTYIDAIDGKIIVTTSAPEPSVEPISKVNLDVNSDDLAAGKAAPAVDAPAGANYTVNAVWTPEVDDTFAYDTEYTLTATYTANDGYCFNEETEVDSALENVSKELKDGKLVVTYSFKTDPKPDEPIEIVALNVNSDDLAAGKAAPAVDAPAGANYTVNAVWTPEVDDTFAYDTEYTLTATYTANDGYCFNEETEVDSALENVSKELKDGELVVTYSFKTGEAPSENTYLIAGDQTDIFGTSWDANNADNTMTKNEDGTYTKAYIVEKSYLAVQLKVVKNGEEWIGDESGNNKAFSLSGPGTFTVKFTPETQTIEILGDIVGAVVFPENPEIYAVGNGEGTWLNGINWDPAAAVNKMTEVEEDVWEIKYENVPDGFDRQVKFAVNGAWTFNFGAPKEDVPAFESGKEFDAAWDGGNITFDTEDNCNITVRLDLRNFDFISKQGAKYTITIENPSVLGDVDGDGKLTIDDATLIQRYLAHLNDFDNEQLELADFDGDGVVTIIDVTMIQRYLAKLN